MIQSASDYRNDHEAAFGMAATVARANSLPRYRMVANCGWTSTPSTMWRPERAGMVETFPAESAGAPMLRGLGIVVLVVLAFYGAVKLMEAAPWLVK